MGTLTHWSNERKFPQKEMYIEDLATILNVTIQDLFNPKDNYACMGNGEKL